MADAKKCDRCGKYYDEQEKKYTVDGNILASIKFISKQNCMIGRCDLCDECAKKLVQFMNPSRMAVETDDIDVLPCVCGDMPAHSVKMRYPNGEVHVIECPYCKIIGGVWTNAADAVKEWNEIIRKKMGERRCE
jgi:hypothetical protein